MRIQNNISLKAYNSFGIYSIARAFASFNSEMELLELATDGIPKEKDPPIILGGGSNILFTHEKTDALVLRNEMKGISLIREDDEHYYVQAAGGENWHRFVCYCIDQQYAGIENLSLIPGTVGASPIQNIGAYGVDISQVFHSLKAFHLKDRSVHEFNLSDCGFGYRESIFKTKWRHQYVILSVCFQLNKKAVLHTGYGAIQQELEKMQVTDPHIKDVSEAVIRIRNSKLPDPAKIGNAGSFFKNPTIPMVEYESLKKSFPGLVGYPDNQGGAKIAAGWLIESAGWKGFRIGDAGCHAQQALVLVNYGHASGAEILELSNRIILDVHEKFSILIEREVNIY